MRFVYKPNNESKAWTTEIVEDDVLPDGFTDVCPPSTPTYKPYFNWETKEWEEHATQEEIILITNQINTEPEPTKIELELEAQKNYITQLESTVLELADLVFMMGV